MKKSLFTISIAILCATGLFLAPEVAVAQQSIGELVKAKDDANKLVRTYIAPAGKAVGHSLNSGWFNSGQALEAGRFDIRVYATIALGSEEDKTFDISQQGLSPRIRLAPGEPSIAPTVFGGVNEGPEMIVYGTNPYTNQEEELGRFNTPQGLGINFAPLAVPQVSVGIGGGTEVAVRFLPKIRFREDYQVNLWGVGLKHSLKQWIPVIGSVSGFDVTAFGGYTHLRASADLNIPPTQEYNRRPVTQSNADFDNQQLVYITKAWTASVIASKTLGVITLYGGLRYSDSDTRLAAEGNYPLVNVRTQVLPPFYEYYIDPIETPIDVAVHDSQVGVNAGFRLKLAFFSIYAEGTYAKYPTAAAGIGVGWN
ncbi:DUF6588 family protein [Rufibacter roseus]|uniref:DUF6588 family protein n=1 Tax=Rufibacter roseus TaxID=1567108 RepID=A0ABW2DIA1_9BACT|nr:DUF6588 family protein [Rufibacter roseus]